MRIPRPTNCLGLSYFLAACGTTGVGIWLSLGGAVGAYVAGQGFLAVACIQWFILLHECGHRTCFRSRLANRLGGHVAGAMTGIPFAGWCFIHGLHHQWTGWQDLDPTTAALAPRPRGRWQRLVVNVAWKYWVPVFSLMYRIDNFWNGPRICRLLPDAARRRPLWLNAIGLAAIYAAVVVWVGPVRLLWCAAPGIWIGFALLDPLMLSQHTHIPLRLSGGSVVTPFAADQQVVFTRSLVFPRAVSRALLMGFDAHELHHRYPDVGGYHLHEMQGDTPNATAAWSWVRAAKRVPAEVFLFENRLSSGLLL